MASDIFTFGLLMWSIIAEREPYNTFNQKTASSVMGGYRLPLPLSCPPGITKTIQRCWEMKLSDRWTAPDLEIHLESLILQDFSHIPFEPVEFDESKRRSVLYESLPSS